MLLSGVMLILTLVVTTARTAPLTTPASNHSTNLLYGRGLRQCSLPSAISESERTGKKPDLFASNRCLDWHIEDLDKQLFALVRHPKSKGIILIGDPLWRTVSSKYRETYEEFEAAIWMRYPSMETHVKMVFQGALKVGFYEPDSLGQRIPSTAERGGIVDPVELEIAWAILRRETIARGNKDKNGVKQYTGAINHLSVIWESDKSEPLKVPNSELEEAYGRHNRAIQERRNAYQALNWGGPIHNRFVYYATHRNPLVGKAKAVDDYIQSQVEKYLQHTMSEDEGTEFLRYLHKVLNDMIDHQALVATWISGGDEYAMYHELFQAVWFRQNIRDKRILASNVYWFTGDATDAPKRINVIEAELSRNYALAVVDKERDPTGAVRHHLAVVGLVRDWRAAMDAGLFVPTTLYCGDLNYALERVKARLKSSLRGGTLPQGLQDEVSQANDYLKAYFLL